MNRVDRYSCRPLRRRSCARRKFFALCIIGSGIAVATGASAQETTTYTYDARGRLTNVQRSGGPESGAVASYTYDTADNRTGVTVSGSANGGSGDTDGGASAPAMIYAVVPLNGYTVIPVAN